MEKDRIMKNFEHRKHLYLYTLISSLLMGVILFLFLLGSQKRDTFYLFLTLALISVPIIIILLIESIYMLKSKIPYMIILGSHTNALKISFYDRKGIMFYFEIILILTFDVIITSFLVLMYNI